MQNLTRKLLRGLLVLFVCAGLGFGTSQAMSASALDECGDHPTELGTCPPFDNDSCNQACLNEGFSGGQCAPSTGDPCCTCLA